MHIHSRCSKRWLAALTVVLSGAFASLNAQQLIIPGNAAQLSVDPDALCSISTDSVLSCYVSSRSERLAVPARIGLVKEVSVGKGFVCAITIDDEIDCWGESSFGRLDVPDAATPAVQIDTGEAHACALNRDGEVVCWGLNSNGRTTPTESGPAYTAVSAGDKHSCALKPDGTVDCWGAEDSGADLRPDNFPLAVQVVADNDASCILSVGGDILCWARAAHESVGVLNVPVNGPYAHITLAGGGLSNYMVCGLDLDGNADCAVTPGRLTSADRAVELQQGAAELGPFSAIDAGALYGTSSRDPRPFFAGCGVRSDGAVACWQAPDRIDTSTSGTPDSPLFVPELSAEIYSSNTIELFWMTPRGFQSRGTQIIYEIYRNGELLTTTGNSGSYLDTTLTAGTTYSYQIRAITTSGARAELSNAVDVDTADRQSIDPDGVVYERPDRPLAAQNLAALVYSASSLELIWDNSGAANVGYEIYMDGVFLDHTTGSSYFLGNLPTDAVYQFQVVTVVDAGDIVGLTNVAVALGDGGICF